MLKNAEFIQSLIRLTIGLLTYVYISYGIDSGYFDVQQAALHGSHLYFLVLVLLSC